MIVEGRPHGDALVAVLTRAQELGFIGPGPVQGQLDHALACAEAVRAVTTEGPSVAAAPEPAAVAEEIPGPLSLVDLGSGGGVPGLVLACVLDAARVTLVESGRRRADFLGWALAVLDLGARAVVVHDRAERVGRLPDHRGRYDVATARSFAAPAPTAECAAPLLRVGGVLVVAEPPDGSVEGRWPVAGLAALGLGDASPLATGYRFAAMRQVEPCPERFPRRTGVPAKRPLF